LRTSIRLATGCDQQRLVPAPQTSTEHPAINLGTVANWSDDDLLGATDHNRRGTDKTHFVAESLQLSDREATSPHSMLR
jgi:hypothetical protein